MTQKNNCLNFIKGIACFGIVYMHTSYDCMASSVVVCAFRFAVPIFFMISGYFAFYENRKTVFNKAKKRCKHIALLFLWAFFINELWRVVIGPLIQNSEININKWLGELFTINSLKNLVLFSQLGWILWFLVALVECYLILMIINHFNIYKCFYIIATILIVLHILLRGYIQYFSIIPEETNIIWFRNVWFMGFPFFMMGNLIHRREKNIKNKIPNTVLVIILFVGVLISFVERYFVALEVSWGVLITVFAIFVFAIQNSKRKIIPLIAWIGENCSMQIYIYQIIVYSVIMIIYKKMRIECTTLLIINPILVYAIITMGCLIKQKLLILIKRIRL